MNSAGLWVGILIFVLVILGAVGALFYSFKQTRSRNDKAASRRKNGADSQSKSRSNEGFRKTGCRERDNKGTRQDDESQATAYWLSRNMRQRFEPYVLYSFSDEKGARSALLEIPCILRAEDTGNLICTEVLTFGCYRTQAGKIEAILCGDDLTWELWNSAKNSFERHNGIRINDLEPPRESRPKSSGNKSPDTGGVSFLREERINRMGNLNTYRIYRAPNAATAKTYLERNPVTRPFFYVVIETPDGNYCRDVQGIYKE